MNIGRCAPGFTLVELLVVVTIIVILLSLLVPAMSKALYQAQLVQCAANQKAVGIAAVGYTFANKRYYPDRAGMPQGTTNAYLQPNNLFSPMQEGYDIRPMLRQKLGLNVNTNTQCALVMPVELEDTLPDEFVFGNQLLFWGWHYVRNARKLPSMTKMGDRFGWESTVNGQTVMKNYNLLVSDFDMNRGSGGYWSSHPDKGAARMHNFQAKRVGLFTAVTFPHTHSWWWTGLGAAANPPREPVDLNYMYDDGSVRRLNDIEVHWLEERTDLIPNTYDHREGISFQVPRQ